MIAIRAATAADAAALAALRWEFRGLREPPQEAEADFTARCVEWMRRELESGAVWRAWVAAADERSGALVGQVWLQIFSKLPNPVGERTKHAYLSNLYVQPSVRGGVGTRLLETALDHARASGADRVLLWPSARSVTLYERYGFVRGFDAMELKL